MKYLKTFKEAIGFKIKGDNRDSEKSNGIKLGFNKVDDLSDKIILLIKKLKIMSEKGEKNEREIAKDKLDIISKRYGINTNNIDKKLSKLGFKFSSEKDIDNDFIDQIDSEIKKLGF